MSQADFGSCVVGLRRFFVWFSLHFVRCFQIATNDNLLFFFGVDFDFIAVIVISFWVSWCGNMTSYRFCKTVVAQVYFHFLFC